MSVLLNIKKFISDLVTPASKTVDIFAPFDGEIVPQTSIPDEAFSEGHMGEGLGLIPSGEEVSAFMTGKLVVLFKTKHAYVIKEPKSGVSVLLHIGINTVKIPDEKMAFMTSLKQDDEVTAKQELCKLNLAVIKSEATSIITPLLIQKDDAFVGKKIVYHKTSGPVSKGELILSVVQQ